MSQPKLRKGTKVLIKSLENTEERCGLILNAHRLVGKVLTIDSFARAGVYRFKETNMAFHEDDFDIVLKGTK